MKGVKFKALSAAGCCVLMLSAGHAYAAQGSSGGSSTLANIINLLMGNGVGVSNGFDHPTGQPNQTCGTPGALETPGHAVNSPGSPFNPDGNAGTHYAGQQPQNSKNPRSVAQYDVACSNQK